MQRWMRGLMAACVLCSPVGFAHAEGPYQVMDHWKVGGTGGWDYMLVDSAAHRLYLAHGPRVEVLDTKTGHVIGAISGLHGTHGIALDPDGKVGYISDGGGNAVVVFDRATLGTVATIPAGTNPDGIIYEPRTKTVWAFNGRSQNVTVIDTKSRTVAATIALPGKPEFPQVDGNGNVFDNIENRNSIVAIDAMTRTVTHTWPLTKCDSPSGLAIDIAHHRLFSVCDGETMAVVDSRSGRQLATATIGDGPDAARYDAKQELAFASSGDGQLAVVDAKHGYKTVQMLKTMNGARTMAFDADTDRAYVVSAEFGARPAATADRPHPRPAVVPDTFQVLVIGRK